MNAISPLFDRRRSLSHWAIAAAVILAVAGCGAMFGPDTWYQGLRKPSWQPPGWVFGPVWTTIYLCLTIALALLLQAPAEPARRQALIWFALQLVFNAAWSPLFFGLHSPFLAFVDISALWCFALISALSALKVDSGAGWLQVPHLLWVSFALILNGVIVALNW